MKKKEIEEWLGLWLVVGIFICFLSTLFIADALDLGIRGQQLFHSDNFIEDDMSEEHKESVERAVDNIAKTFGGPAFFKSERFDIALPNLTNLGVLTSLSLLCFLMLCWNFVGKKILSKLYNCKFNITGDVIEINGIPM